MKNNYLLLILVLLVQPLFLSSQKISPIQKVGTSIADMNTSLVNVQVALELQGFEILGVYSPAKKEQYGVISYTRQDLKNICFSSGASGILASVLRVALINTDAGVRVLYLNPEYVFRAYLGSAFSQYQADLEVITASAKLALSSIGIEFSNANGEISVDELQNYSYKPGMPQLDDVIVLKEFGSYSEALLKIKSALSARKKGNVKVYEIENAEQEIAIFGVALLDPKGESDLITDLGDNFIVALPIELIIEGGNVKMLHMRYRLPLFYQSVDFSQVLRKYPSIIEKLMNELVE